MTRRLHIGGAYRKAGWEVLDVRPAPHVDHVADARDLGRFDDGAFGAVYASHVLEHFDYIGELTAVLIEWRRLLAPGALLYLSVPDLDVLCSLFTRKDALSTSERFDLMQMMFGGHDNPFDYHKVGLNGELLAHYLNEAGFSRARRVRSFGFFRDASLLTVRDVPVSLNVIARYE
ncbi:MAG: methyltransferase domain-containing protein [Pseudomonadota bacterium]